MLFGTYGRAAGVPGSHPIHILGEVKNIPIHIIPIAKIVPIHILGGLKRIPHSAASLYICLYNGSYPRPGVVKPLNRYVPNLSLTTKAV